MRAVIRKLFCYHESGEPVETYGIRVYDDNGKLVKQFEYYTEEEVMRHCDSAEYDEVDW
jgi:hypothetical protein